jgi:ribosomal protein S18 acetylase RimI-like enzyme
MAPEQKAQDERRLNHMAVSIRKACDENDARIAAFLADTIWREHFTPILPAGQVDYMLGKFQSEPAISRQISADGYAYYLAFAYDAHTGDDHAGGAHAGDPRAGDDRASVAHAGGAHAGDDHAGGAPVGYCAVKPEGGGSLFLSKLYVLKEYRGRGISGKLLRRALQDAGGVTRVHLTVNRHNEGTIAIYKHMGFAVYGEKSADIGGGYEMDDFLMELKI